MQEETCSDGLSQVESLQVEAGALTRELAASQVRWVSLALLDPQLACPEAARAADLLPLARHTSDWLVETPQALHAVNCKPLEF